MCDFSNRIKYIDVVPEPYRKIFKSYPCFNIVQSEVLEDILHSSYDSVVVSAPTGSGKTVIFELAIVRLMVNYNECSDDKFKILYICPMKSLCQERLQDWYRKFSEFDMTCTAVTGDSDVINFQDLNASDIIISTPEKWDSLTRKWKDHKKIAEMFKLVLIDEIHLLNEDFRGSTLEVIVCRMKSVGSGGLCGFTDENQKIRFIAVSASIPNSDDIAEWLGRSNTKHFKFPEGLRPVPLNKIVLGYHYNPKRMSMFKFDLSLNYRLKNLIIQHSEGKPTVIFCSTRKGVEMTVKHLVSALQIMFTPDQKRNLEMISNHITDVKLRECIKYGIGYHHAGMIPETRQIIEEVFRNGHLPVLVCTSTLAMGVNLPAHLIIIKSTKAYVNCEYRDYTEIAIQQMIGRAGRPQYDTSATAIILTTDEDKHKFEKMIHCNTPIESNLHRHLTEHLNAEIVLGTITSLDIAMHWLASTFLYVRAKKNPHHYGLNISFGTEQIDKKLLEICQIDLNKLVKAGMITMDQNVTIRPTIIGEIMANYYVAFETMKLFTQLSGEEILMQILSLVSKCQEFSDIRLRVNDKKTLNSLNKNSNGIRFPLNGRIQNPYMKVNCIIQAVLGNLDIQDHSLVSESMTIIRNGERIAKCLIQYLSTRKANCFSATKHSIILAKCFHAKLWENSQFVSKQLDGIGNVLSKQLANAGKKDFNTILLSNPREIEMILKKKPPFGDQIIEQIRHLPRYSMRLEHINENDQILKLTIELVNLEDLQQKVTIPLESFMILLVGSEENEILFYQKYKLSYLIENPVLVKFIKTDLTKNLQIEANFISEDIVGIDCSSTLLNRNKKEQKQEMHNYMEAKEESYMELFLDMYKKVKDKRKPKNLSSEAKEKTIKQAGTSIKKPSSNQKSTLTKVVNKMNEVKSRSAGRYNTNNTDYTNVILGERIDQTNNTKNGKTEVRNIEMPQDESMSPLASSATTVINNKELILHYEKTTEKHKVSMKSAEWHDQNVIFGEQNEYFESLAKELENHQNSQFLTKTSHMKEKRNLSSSQNDFKLSDEMTSHEFRDDQEHRKNTQTSYLNILDHQQTFECSDKNLETNKLCTNIYQNKNNSINQESSNFTLPIHNDLNNQELKKRHEASSTVQNEKIDTNTDIDWEWITQWNPSLAAMSQKYLSDRESQPINSNATISQVKPITTNNHKQKRQLEEVSPTTDVQNMTQNSNLFLDRFKPNEKKKFSHVSENSVIENSSTRYQITDLMDPMQNQEMNVSMAGRSKKTNQKTLTWRSPLVFSPNTKFSPQNISHFSQGRIQEQNQPGIFNDSMESVTTRNNDLTLTFQKSPKKMVLSQNPFNKKPRESQFFLSDKHYGDVIDNKYDNKRELEERYTGEKEQTKDDRNEPSNVMDYYSQLTAAGTDLKEKRKLEKNNSYEEDIANKKNVLKMQPTLESQMYSPRSCVYSTNDTHKMITNNQKQSQYTLPSHKANCNSVHQPQYHQNPTLHSSDYFNCPNNMHSGSGNQVQEYFSVDDRSYQERCLNQNISSTMPFLKTCKRGYNKSVYHEENMHPSQQFVTQYCGPECNCEVIPPINPHCSIISSPLHQNLNQTPKHLMPSAEMDSTYHSDNQQNNYFTHQSANTSFHQKQTQLCYEPRSEQIAHDFSLHDGNSGCNYRIMPQRNISRMNNVANASFHDDSQTKWESISCNQRSVADESANAVVKQEYVDSNDSGLQRMYPMNQYAIHRNFPMSRSSIYGDGFYPKCIDVCNCQRCFNYPNPNPHCRVRMFSQIPLDPYTNQSPYFQHPSAMLRPHFLNNPYLHHNQLENHYPDMVPPSVYYTQGNDKEYVMNKFLLSLSQNR